jgi:hypothetical protein
MSKYIKIKDSISKSYINDTQKKVIKIIKDASKKNINELNKKVTELFKMDEEFKEELFKKT